MTQQPPTLEKEIISVDRSGSETVFTFHEPVTMYTATDYERTFRSLVSAGNISSLRIELSQVTTYDSYLVVLIGNIREFAGKSNIQVEFTGMTDDMQRLLEAMDKSAVKPDVQKEKRPPRIIRFVTDIGKATTAIAKDGYGFIEFVGDFVISSLTVLRHPMSLRWKDFPYHFSRAGVGSVPIVTLIGFLNGVIISYQSAVQLKDFGAEAYLAKLVALSLTRELAPLITAIIVAGRSGSGFAAEIGTMNVSEEVDALKSMGFNIHTFLIIPRVLAVMVAIPILVIIAEIAGVIGGMIAGVASLDLTVSGYMSETQLSLQYVDVFAGLFKSLVFGFLIAMVGCFRGLQVSGGAESVGRYTTSAVVTGIFLIIFADAMFSFVFQMLEIYK